MKFLLNSILCLSAIHASISYTSQRLNYTQSIALLKSAIGELGLSNDQAQEVLAAFAVYGTSDNSTYSSLPMILQNIKNLQKEAIAASLTDNTLITICFTLMINSQKCINESFNGQCNYNYIGPDLTTELYQNLILFYKTAIASTVTFTTPQIGYLIGKLFNFLYYFNYPSTFSAQQKTIINVLNSVAYDIELMNIYFSIIISQQPSSPLLTLNQSQAKALISIYNIAKTAQLSTSQIQQAISILASQPSRYLDVLNIAKAAQLSPAQMQNVIDAVCSIIQQKQPILITPQVVTNLTTLKSAAIHAGLKDNELVTLWLISSTSIPIPLLNNQINVALAIYEAESIVAIYQAAVAAHITSTNMQTLMDALYQTLLIDMPAFPSNDQPTTVLNGSQAQNMIAVYQAAVSAQIVSSDIHSLMTALYQAFLIQLPEQNTITTDLFTAQEVADIISIYQQLVQSNHTDNNTLSKMIGEYTSFTFVQNMTPAAAKAKVMLSIAQL